MHLQGCEITCREEGSLGCEIPFREEGSLDPHTKDFLL
jgi:hypothetical protein